MASADDDVTRKVKFREEELNAGGDEDPPAIMMGTGNPLLEATEMMIVIIKLLGRNIGYRALCQRIKDLRRPTCDFRVVDLDCNFFLVQLTNEGDTKEALIGGPWAIMGHYLFVYKFDRDFHPVTAMVTKVVTWARFPNLVDKAIKVDFPSQLAQKGHFARVTVEVDLAMLDTYE
ncbi:hypothetical protein Scep_016531 [Stephania cephalantha]|uniref:DUF4283 domain-containing protein n=1 Tax=Stephania cephalantha TaxID=152367 RepID=A0AAP0IMV0_9MAGN